jgi:hypothetical protein
VTVAKPKPVAALPFALAATVGRKLRATLKSVAGAGPAAEALAKSASKMLERRAGQLTVFLPAIARSLEDVGKSVLARRVQLMAALLGDTPVLKVIAKVLRKKKPAIVLVLDRLPLSELMALLEKEMPKALKAAKAEKARIVKRLTNGINELSGIFHPDVIAQLERRAARVFEGMRKHPTFLKEFKVLEDGKPSIILSMRAAGVEGSAKATKQFVDARGVIRVLRLSDGQIFFVKLGDVQVKSTNVRDLIEQFPSDKVREARGLDFAFRDRQGGHIPFSSFIDPVEAGLVGRRMQPIGVGQGFFDPKLVTNIDSALRPLYIPHDTPLSTSAELAKAFVDAMLDVFE